MKKFKNKVSIFLIVCISLNLIACTKKDIKNNFIIGTNWYNSSLDGAIDKNTKVSLKDDFYTAVNFDWLVNTKIPETLVEIDREDYYFLKKRIENISKGIKDEEQIEGVKLLDDDKLKKTEDLILTFSKNLTNWEKRDKEGASVLKPYIDFVYNIKSLREMTDYIENKDKKNVSMLSFMPFSVEIYKKDKTKKVVQINVNNNFLLGSKDYYIDYLNYANEEIVKNNKIVERFILSILNNLGYDDKEANDILNDCYAFEIKLAKNMLSTEEQEKIEYDEEHNKFKFANLKTLEGSFPLSEILESFNLKYDGDYIIYEPDFVKGVGEIYKDENLEEIKAFFIIHTIYKNIYFLDKQIYDSYREENMSDETKERVSKMSEEEKDNIMVSDNLIRFLPECLDTIYVSKYVTKEEKTTVIKIINLIIDKFSIIIKENNWLTEETKEKALDKLKNIYIRALYPEFVYDYTDLKIDDNENLLQTLAKINDFVSRLEFNKLHEEFDKEKNWDRRVSMNGFPTVYDNAFYDEEENSINILAGLIGSKEYFSLDKSDEENFVSVGFFIGHEICHAFDTLGYQYDKDGYFVDWWDAQSKLRFHMRAKNLENYYDNITLIEELGPMNGELCSGEAIADIASFKALLYVAKDYDNFDYKKFFESYAISWKIKMRKSRYEVYMTNEHPIHSLRANVTLQQFDEFLKTFDIKEGDGMYLASKDRIAVW